MAVPGPVTSDLSAGCHQIIRDWQGTLVTSAADVVEQLSPLSELPEQGDQAQPVIGRDLLDLESKQVLDALPRRSGLGTSQVARRAGIAPTTALRKLGELAAGGFVERCADGWRLRRS